MHLLRGAVVVAARWSGNLRVREIVESLSTLSGLTSKCTALKAGRPLSSCAFENYKKIKTRSEI